jgi:L-fuculose-phosphate aldolase
VSVHDDVLAAAKDMLRIGLTAGTSGNISGRVDEGHFVITPSSIDYNDMVLSDLVVLDLDNNVIEGDKNPSSEKALHAECYKLYPEVQGVVHSHPIYATMFACVRQPIPAVVDEFAIYVGGDVQCAEYGQSGSDELGQNAAKELADVGTTLLASHGMVSIGPSPAKALHQAGIVERTAQIVWGTKALGPAVPLPPEVNKNFAMVYKHYMRTHA